MTSKTLSICIATYNRAHLIGETLESIIQQVTDEVEILVVDGASPDETEAIVHGYQAHCPQLKYIRLPVKGGVDQDYDKSVELAEGKYCWLFSDDDILNPGAINAVLKAIKLEYSLVVVNAEIKNMDLSQQLSERILTKISNYIYEDNPADQEQFFAEIGEYLTFIGGVVMLRDLWLSRNRSKYFGSRFIHVGVIFQNLLPGKVLVIVQPWISIRLGNAEWANLGFEIWMFKWPELINSFSNFSDKSKLSVCRPKPWKRLHTLIYFRSIGAYSITEYSKWLEQRLSSPWHRFIARMIAKIPFKIANGFMRLYAKIRRNKILMYHLTNSRNSYKNHLQ
jgi:abequosyltransferase